MTQIRLLAVSYVRTVLKQNKSQASHLVFHPVLRLQKVPYKMQLDILPSLQKILRVIYDPSVRKSTY